MRRRAEGNTAKRTPFRQRFVRWFWGIFIGLLVFVALLFTSITLGLFGPMPTFEELENPNSIMATEVLSADERLLGTYFLQNRSLVSYEELNEYLKDALISVEDARFYEHSGVDAKGLFRVFYKTLLRGQEDAGGGSTITQQLAKNLFPRDSVMPSTSFGRAVKLVISKFKEWVTAVKLERDYSKDEIMTMYLNTISFGSNAFGIRMAARTFFNTTPDSLKCEEAALLVGLVKGPTRYSPVRNPARACERRNTVLRQMVKYGKLSQETCDSLSALPITLHYRMQDHNAGLATYLRELIRLMMTAREPRPGMYFTHEQYRLDSIHWAENPLYGWCRKNPKPDGSFYNLYTDGLKIHTTVDYRMQQIAERAVEQHLGGQLQRQMDAEKRKNLFSYDVPREAREVVMELGLKHSPRYKALKAQGATQQEIEKAFRTPDTMRVFTWHGLVDTVLTPYDSMLYYKRLLRAGFMAMEPRSGAVRAYVGGTNLEHFSYDNVFSSRRQVGSIIKPFLYTLAVQEGFDPCLKVPNTTSTFDMGDTVWQPRTAGASKRDGQMVTLMWGLAQSSNNVSAWLVKQLTPQAIAALIESMGIRSHIDPVPSIFLGTSEISLWEMVSAYTAFAANGVQTEPLLVSSIEDRNGNLLASFSPTSRNVISPETAYTMVRLLQNVVDHGSGNRLRRIYTLEGPLGGKTGTTQNHSDGWFMCIHPQLVIGAWVGNEDRAVHFTNIAQGQGASMALPIVGLFLQGVYQDKSTLVNPESQWAVPPTMVGRSFNCDDASSENVEQSDDFF